MCSGFPLLKMTADNYNLKQNSQTSAENRKISKGVIERKRRARINRSLAELKFIVLTDSKDKALQSKLDKAKILERTLTYIQALQNRQTCKSLVDCDLPLTKYRDGYFACMNEIDQFLTMENADETARHKITNYLTKCSNEPYQLTKEIPLERMSPQMCYENSVCQVPQYAMVPGCPLSSNSSCCTTQYMVKSEPVWRPW